MDQLSDERHSRVLEKSWIMINTAAQGHVAASFEIDRAMDRHIEVYQRLSCARVRVPGYGQAGQTPNERMSCMLMLVQRGW